MREARDVQPSAAFLINRICEKIGHAQVKLGKANLQKVVLLLDGVIADIDRLALIRGFQIVVKRKEFSQEELDLLDTTTDVVVKALVAAQLDLGRGELQGSVNAVQYALAVIRLMASRKGMRLVETR